MSSVINQLLFTKVLSLEDTLSSLTPFMYSPVEIVVQEIISLEKENPITPMENKIIISKEEPIIPKPIIQRTPKLFISDKEDTLFWGIYIQAHGYNAYQIIGQKYKNEEIAEKQKIMIHLKANSMHYKTASTRKLTNVDIQEIMSELMTNRKTSLLTVSILAIYYKMPITLVKDNIYLEYGLNERPEEKECTLYFRHGRYGLYLDDSSAPKFSKTTAFKLKGPNKPLRGVSTYKMAELQEIFEKVVPTTDISGNSTDKKRKKGDIYNAIIETCLW
jgi:hypothetical protein